MSILFIGLDSEIVTKLRATGLDAYGQPIECKPAGQDGWPCRHCLGQTPPNRDMLTLAHRPFETLNPYAETGPIFLCADECAPYEPSPILPDILRSPRYLLRGYSRDERIIYGTGDVVATAQIAQRAQELLQDPAVAFVDLRSAANNCFQCRVVRG